MFAIRALSIFKSDIGAIAVKFLIYINIIIVIKGQINKNRLKICIKITFPILYIN